MGKKNKIHLHGSRCVETKRQENPTKSFHFPLAIPLFKIPNFFSSRGYFASKYSKNPVGLKLVETDEREIGKVEKKSFSGILLEERNFKRSVRLDFLIFFFLLVGRLQ